MLGIVQTPSSSMTSSKDHNILFYQQTFCQKLYGVIVTNICVFLEQLQTPEYICFINRHSSELPRSNSISSSASGLPAWKQRKRKALPPRVKSMDELILEESMRRNNRRTTGSTIPDLRVNGNNAPGYQVSCVDDPGSNLLCSVELLGLMFFQRQLVEN